MPTKVRCLVLPGSNSTLTGSSIRIDGRLLYVSEANQPNVAEFSFDTIHGAASSDQEDELGEYVVRPSTASMINGSGACVVAFGAHSPATMNALVHRAADLLNTPFASLQVAAQELNGHGQASELIRQTSLASPSELPTLLNAARTSSPEHHRIVTLTMISEEGGKQPSTILSLITLASIHTPDAAALARVLAAISSGTSVSSTLLNESKLALILKSSLLGNSHITLLPTLLPGQPYQDSLATLKFSLQCQNLSPEPQSQRGVTLPAFETVKQLRQELEMTHAHYQKLLESVAGREWSKDMGAIERDVLTPRRQHLVTESTQGSTKHHQEEDNASQASSRWETAVNKSKTQVGGGGNVAAMDAQLKTVRSQMEAYRLKLVATEALMDQRRQEQEAGVDRMMSKDRSQLAEIKRLRQQLSDAKSGRDDAESHRLQFEEEIKLRSEQERVRLEGDMEALRAQMQQMAVKMDRAERENRAKAEEERKRRDARVESAEDRVREQVAAAAAEKLRQVENIKQQSQYHLNKKADEVSLLRSEIARLKSQREDEMRSLQEEVEYLVEYGDKATDLLKKVEGGSYPVTEKGGLRAFKIPQRDRPGALHGDRLKTLKTLVEGIDRLVASSNEASNLAAASLSASLPAPSHHHYSTGLGLGIGQGSRPSSAVSRRSDGEGTSNLTLAGGEQQQLELLKAQWEASMRETITDQVVADLRSDQTVEYIRSLEAQLARYRAELQAERKKQSDMTVALRSVQRQVSRPESALNRALISTGPLSPSQGPSWGPGHSPKNYRPVTASATMRSGYLGSPSSPANSNSKSNAWTISGGAGLGGSFGSRDGF